jgi:hypothetical protein
MYFKYLNMLILLSILKCYKCIVIILADLAFLKNHENFCFLKIFKINQFYFSLIRIVIYGYFCDDFNEFIYFRKNYISFQYNCFLNNPIN